MNNVHSTAPANLSATKVRNGLLYILTFVGVCTLMLITMDRSLNPYDEGVIYVGAMRVAEGAVPHRDFYANYGPAQFYLLAALFKLLGPAAFVARLWGCIVKAMIVFAAYGVGRRVAGPHESLLAAGLATVWLCSADMTVWPAWPALLLALLSAACLMDYLSKKAAHLPLAGSLVGLSALFRYDIGVLVFFAEAIVIVLHAIVSQGPQAASLSGVLRSLKGYAAGSAIIILPLLGWYAAAGAIPDFIFDVVTFPSKNYAATRSLPFPPFPTSVPASVDDYIVFSPLVVGLAALIMLSGRWRTAVVEAHDGATAGNATDAPWWSTLVLVMLTIAFFAKGFVRVSVIHMTPAVVLAFLLSLTFRWPRGRPISSVLVSLAALALMLPTIFDIADLQLTMRENVDIAQVIRGDANRRWGNDSTCRSLACSDRARYMRMDQAEVAAVDYVDERTSPGDLVFSGLTHHDRVFANDVMFYFLSARQPVSKWYHFDPGLQTTAEIQRDIIDEMQEKRPRFAILSAAWDFSREPNASAKSSGVFLLDSFLAARYRQVAHFGSITVCELEP